MARGGNASTVALSDFIRQEKDAILQSWESRARQKVAATEQTRAVLIDSIPQLLDRIAANADAMTEGKPVSAPHSIVAKHAAERIEQGYCLADLVAEYIQLRATIFERLEELGVFIAPREARQLHRAIDDALGESAKRYVTTHERMLRAVDRLSAVASAHRPIADVLAEIIHAMKEASGADVDSVAILLLGEDGRLHRRASSGLEAEVERDFSVAVGDGFAGTIAATKRPLFLPNAAEHPLVVSRLIRERGTKGLYGVPLLDEGAVLGVAHVGSRIANVFSDDDLMLFRAMCVRAASIIVRAQFVEALQRTAEFREQFIGVLGHDLRSPLGTIVMSAQLLLTETPATELLRSSLERIVRTAGRMDRLIGDTLDFTRVRFGGGLVLHRSRVDLRTLAGALADELRPRLTNRKVVVSGYEGPPGQWDRERLAQALANLIDNALQHGEPSRDVEIDLRTEDGMAVCDVTSHGRTIPPEQHATLFEPFSKSSASAGLGLGLFIAHEVVRAHGGVITVTSCDAKTTFSFRLPLSPP